MNSEFSTYDSHGLEEIRVVRYHECELTILAKRIQKKMTWEIDVGTLLLRLDHAGNGGPIWLRLNQRHVDFGRQEVTESDRQVRDRPERAEVGFLTPRRIRISGSSANAGRVVTDAMNVTVSGQQEFCEPRGIEPLVRRAFETTVVEVEAIDVDVGAGHKKQRLPFGSLAPYPRRERGDWNFRSARSLRPLNCDVKERPKRSGRLGPTT